MNATASYRILLALVGALALTRPADAAPSEPRDDSSIDIGDVGSERIGGPGVGRPEAPPPPRPEEVLTESSLPAPGQPRRMEGLHILAERYFGGKMWKEACAKYGQVEEEFGDDGLSQRPGAADKAGRSYRECAATALRAGDLDQAKRWLDQATALRAQDPRIRALRRKMLKRRYRARLEDGDLDGAMDLHQRYQQAAGQPDEEERIWFGERLSEQAWQAHRAKDPIERDLYMAAAESIAPQNVALRELRQTLTGHGAILTRIAVAAAGVLALLFALSRILRWYARRRVARLTIDETDAWGEEL